MTCVLKPDDYTRRNGGERAFASRKSAFAVAGRPRQDAVPGLWGGALLTGSDDEVGQQIGLGAKEPCFS